MAKKPLILLALDIVVFLPALFFPGVRHSFWAMAVPTLLLVVLIGTLLWPSGGVDGYFSYRTPVVIAAFLAELWIIVGGLALQLPADLRVSNRLFQAFLAVFFLLTTINSLPGLAGQYRRGVSLRPDLIFGGGAYLVRGEIFVALGIELFTAPELVHPVWNWWALVVEIGALLILVGLRGILKMQMRRARFLGADTWLGSGMRSGVWVREIFLYLALFLVVYAFANIFLGRVPFTWAPATPHGGSQWLGGMWLAASFLVLVPLRGWLKTRLAEPSTLGQELGKQLLLWLGLVLLLYGFQLVFGGRVLTVHAANLNWGLWVSALGFLMLVPLRALALREEFRGTVRIMTAAMVDLPDSERRMMLAKRLATVARLPRRERLIQMQLISSTVDQQPAAQRERMQRTRMAILEDMPALLRERLQAPSQGKNHERHNEPSTE